MKIVDVVKGQNVILKHDFRGQDTVWLKGSGGKVKDVVHGIPLIQIGHVYINITADYLELVK